MIFFFLLNKRIHLQIGLVYIIYVNYVYMSCDFGCCKVGNTENRKFGCKTSNGCSEFKPTDAQAYLVIQQY